MSRLVLYTDAKTGVPKKTTLGTKEYYERLKNNEGALVIPTGEITKGREAGREQ